MYYKRQAVEAIRKLSKMFGAVLVTGARQVGKTTLLQEITGGMGYVTLDDKIQLVNAVEQSGTFFKVKTLNGNKCKILPDYSLLMMLQQRFDGTGDGGVCRGYFSNPQEKMLNSCLKLTG